MMKKLLYVIAQKGFRDEEFFIPYEKLKNEGFVIDVMSIKKETAYGSIKKTFEPNLGFENIPTFKMNEYSAIIIAGGPGALELGTHQEFIEFVNKFHSKKLLVCAICIAPRILTKTDFASGKSMTVWNGDGKQASVLESKGVIYRKEPVFVDGNLITADGPESAGKFADEILKKLKK